MTDVQVTLVAWVMIGILTIWFFLKPFKTKTRLDRLRVILCAICSVIMWFAGLLDLLAKLSASR